MDALDSSEPTRDESTDIKAPFGIDQLIPFGIRDFRLLWIGAFLSFTGSWVQTVGQGYLMWELTHDPAALTWTTFCGMIPFTIIGPAAGAMTDIMNRRLILILCQIGLGLSAIFLAAAVYYKFVQKEHIYLLALMNGIIGTIETPTRQSLVSTVVPRKFIPAAVPIQATTFNGARILGPWIGSMLMGSVGIFSTYLVNGISYIALIFAVASIKADLTATRTERSSLAALIAEGMRYTFKDRRLRILFIMEGLVAICGLVYVSLIPAFGAQVMHLNEGSLGSVYTAVGIGAVTALVSLIAFSKKPWKGKIVRVSMTCFAAALIGLSFTTYKPLDYVLYSVLGACAMTLFNTTNTLFQTLAPEHLRGRVLAMHIWAISGLAPLGMPIFGQIARQSGTTTALFVGGILVGLGAIYSLTQRRSFRGMELDA